MVDTAAGDETTTTYTPQEMMVCAAAREIRNGEVVFVGLGLPVLASILAIRLRAPRAKLLFESGILGSVPGRLALSISDPSLVTDSIMVVEFFDFFTMVLQNGNVDLGFIGGAQVDRFGNVNSTVIGDYRKPMTRFPGGGGAYDTTMAKRTIIIMPQEKRRFVESIDFVTTPGHRQRGRTREQMGIRGTGPSAVVTTMGVMRFDETGEMYLDSYFEGSSVEEIKKNCGWELKVSPNAQEMPHATADELRIIRELDPRGLLLKKG